MTSVWRARLTALAAAATVAYVGWSQLALYQSRRRLGIERQRVYNIADQLELWKELSAGNAGTLDQLRSNERGFDLTQVTRSEAWTPPAEGDTLYVTSRGPLSSERKQELDRYFSELVLGNYFSVIVDSKGRIKNMAWDKP